MDDSLLNPIQCLENDVRIDLRPSKYYQEQDNTCQSIQIPKLEMVIPIEYHGVLPSIHVRRPTPDELHQCSRVELTSLDDWNPNNINISTHHSIKEVITNNNDTCIGLYNEVDCILFGTRMISKLSSTIEIDDAKVTPIATNTRDQVTPEDLSRILHIGLPTAKRTLKATTQKFIRTAGHTLKKRFKTERSYLRYNQLSTVNGEFYVDSIVSQVKSLRGYVGGNLFCNRLGFFKFYPMENLSSLESSHTLRSLIHYIGIPRSLHSDNHGNFKDSWFKRLARRFGIMQTFTEPHSPWQNRAENGIQQVKQYARILMQNTETPVRLWCFCFEYAADVLTICVNGRYELRNRTPFECVCHHTPDISEYVSFSWFQWCYYLDESTSNKVLCRWLGPAHHVGQSFCSYILLANGEYIARSTVVPIDIADLTSDEMKYTTSKFMDSINLKIGNEKVALNLGYTQFDTIYYDVFGDAITDDNNDVPYNSSETTDNSTGTANIPIENTSIEVIEEHLSLEEIDDFIGTNVVIPGRDGIEPVLGIVKRLKRDSNGNIIGVKHDNPIMDTRIFELEFPDGRVEEYSTNIIAENLFSQVDDDGFDLGLVKEIISHRKDIGNAVEISAGTYLNNGVERPVITTKGWSMRLLWVDGSTSWQSLKEIKDAFPIETAEYATTHKLTNEPAFKWWVNKTLRHRDALIKRMNTKRKVRKGRIKYGIELPADHDFNDARRLDVKNGNTLWVDAINKEMGNARVAFDLLERNQPVPVGWKKITCHLVFDVKYDGRRKARYVAGGHLTDPPKSLTYASVVSRDSVRLGFLIAALNDLKILAGDIQNAYLNASTPEKNYFIAGPEWKSDQGRPIKIVRALYGLRTSGLAFRNHLADILGNVLKFKPSLADPDVWLRSSTKADGNKYYSYILVYVDDVLIIDEDPKRYMDLLQSSYTVNPASICEPDRYLGADINKVHYEDGSIAYTISSDNYIANAIKTIKMRLAENQLRFNPKLSDPSISAPQPFSSLSYQPELDTSQLCNDDELAIYQNIIGILRWSIELGRIDIGYEVSILSRYLAQPRTGHLVQVFHILKYLDIHKQGTIAMDPGLPKIVKPIQDVEARMRDMKFAYPDAIEEIPPNAPIPRGKSIRMSCFVDANHASDKITRRSQSGIIIYCNSAPILWYSKRQNTVESSTFGSEFVALRLATELVMSLRYKLRMFGIPIDGHTDIYCDNESVYKNVSHVDSQLKKKHNSICYHRVREAVAAGTIFVHKVESAYNLADILTKSLPSKTRIFIRSKIML